MQGAAGVADSTVPDQGNGPGATPRAALHNLRVQPIPVRIAASILVRHHYLHSMPGGTQLAFGVLLSLRLLGALTLGAGPYNAHRLVEKLRPEECLTLTRLWLSDEMPPNSESRVLGVLLRSLKKSTTIRLLVSYADPSHGHMGTIYQATGWLYTGLSEAMPLYDLGDHKLRHSRSLSHAFGTRDLEHFADRGVPLRTVKQAAKHRYLYLLDHALRDRLTVPILPYPKKEKPACR